MQSGIRPTRIDHRDYDYLKTKKFGATPPSLPREYSVDAGLRVPNQNDWDYNFTPAVPPMPFGCTNYAQCEICADEDGCLYDPSYLESITHANARGGTDMRTALNALVKNGVRATNGEIITTHPAYFNIRASGAIDSFDAVRLAMLSTYNEKRGVSVGSPYWYAWAGVGANGILPSADFTLRNASWHNWVIKGWKDLGGTTYLVCQMLQGVHYGDKGFVYLTREQFNATMAVNGAVAFTIDKLMPGEKVETIDVNLIQLIVSYVRSLFRR